MRPRPCGTSWTCSSSEGITGPRRSRAKLVPLSGMSSFRRHSSGSCLARSRDVRIIDTPTPRCRHGRWRPRSTRSDRRSGTFTGATRRRLRGAAIPIYETVLATHPRCREPRTSGGPTAGCGKRDPRCWSDVMGPPAGPQSPKSTRPSFEVKIVLIDEPTSRTSSPDRPTRDQYRGKSKKGLGVRTAN